jgi:hypothetical protein
LYWPTQDSELPNRVVTLRGSSQTFNPTAFNRLPAGNWAVGQGCVAIAGMSELVVYCPPRISPQGPMERPHARRERGSGLQDVLRFRGLHVE